MTGLAQLRAHKTWYENLIDSMHEMGSTPAGIARMQAKLDECNAAIEEVLARG